MSDSSAPSRRSDPGATSDSDPLHDIDGRDYDLHSVVVQYDDAPDRCTVYPRRDRCVDRMAAWLSADLDAFVGLEERR